jgi:hypothetical protein
VMHELEKSDLCIVVKKPANNSEGAEAESVERRRGQGEHGQGLHVPDTEPGKRVTGT